MNFVESTKLFIKSATWLTDEDKPAVVGLLKAAESLDEVLNPPVLAQYRLFYTGLLKKAPVKDASVDPLEALLKR